MLKVQEPSFVQEIAFQPPKWKLVVSLLLGTGVYHHAQSPKRMEVGKVVLPTLHFLGHQIDLYKYGYKTFCTQR